MQKQGQQEKSLSRPKFKAGEPKPQRVRDPLHNLVEFGTGQFEHVMWQVIQTPSFQRLRRVKQLGFSELVYPGATHSRFAHSVGVFHTARHLMRIIERHMKEGGHRHHYREHQAHEALAASPVHDLGHGMFSHAFEEIGKKLKLPMADHEHVGGLLIREGEVSEAFREMGSGFANDVATVIKRGRPIDLYGAVVSSQFDADRLDYMQRDRLMTGVQNSGIDFTWLMANLEIGRIKTGVDEETVGEIETFVLGPKAFYAAETYVLALFHLYPTIYFHKATRAAEKLFSVLMLRIISLIQDAHINRTGLPKNHPLARFAMAPESVDSVLALDDTVFWGALPMLADAPDRQVRDCALRLKNRQLPKCIDIRHQLVDTLGLRKISDPRERAEVGKKLDRLIASIETKLNHWAEKNSNDEAPRILTDRATRDPYKRFEESKGPLNQIHIRLAGNQILDVASISSVIAAVESFSLFRAYACDEDSANAITHIVDSELSGG
ncbi:HD domain-containing protein [Bradyrhizobium sp.]|uniref:HD domain-containing protein n=1 Tax=Bradyrhizobium sp. TaxID=376 RepID=UPI002D1FB3E9|nr:HD domain-containing protein [Bradyrhizobium sp.]